MRPNAQSSVRHGPVVRLRLNPRECSSENGSSELVRAGKLDSEPTTYVPCVDQHLAATHCEVALGVGHSGVVIRERGRRRDCGVGEAMRSRHDRSDELSLRCVSELPRGDRDEAGRTRREVERLLDQRAEEVPNGRLDVPLEVTGAYRPVGSVVRLQGGGC